MFWEGFFKKAGALGVKALKPLSSTGRMVGNKPMSNVSTVAAYKPNPLPTPAVHGANQISAPKLNTSGTMNKVPKAKKKLLGVGDTRA